jgi:hypothetical protein
MNGVYLGTPSIFSKDIIFLKRLENIVNNNVEEDYF